ncbi:hypothetical protein [Halodesulfovibrio sp. MK-HDV]|uniref:hypothetical protein n=1 Tax=Halodesulfovibrio sp. MK-HDV TaxID=2599925 RepID=UPI00136F4B96|nr:hypothetical protein [Halodesulfovibrio sp. MK-HDV]KAF1074914.1 hypothetical protein MKHDV_02466 [Halodesulfovibrio sp. MK-HDV]
MKYLLCVLIALLTGCVKQLPPQLPVMPNMQSKLLQHNWPVEKGTFQVNGSLKIHSMTIPVQGIVSIEKGGSEVSIALLTQMGTSIFEAKLTQDSYKMFTVSPMIKKYPRLEPIFIRMTRALYLSERISSICTTEGADNITELRCSEQNILYSYTVDPQRPDVIRLQRRINAKNETIVDFKDWQKEQNTAYPTRLFYEDEEYNFTGELIQKPVSYPQNITTEKAS